MLPRALSTLALVLLVGCPSPVGDDDTAPGPDDDDATDDDDGTDDDDADDGWRSVLYPGDWTPADTVDGRFLHDFSYAGYRLGDAPPLNRVVPTLDVRDFGADPTGATDATAEVQSAIDAATEPCDILLPAGEYRFDRTLRITTDGVVLRGEGVGVTSLWFTAVEGMSDRGHVAFAGSVQRGEDHLLAEDGVPRSHDVVVATRGDLDVGVEVAVGWTISEAFVEEHGMTGTWEVFNGTWRPFFRRTVVAVEGDGPFVVTLDVPLRYPALVRDGASLRVESGYLREVGVRDLSISTAATRDEALSVDRTHAIRMEGVADAWVSRVDSWESPQSEDGRHLLSGGIAIVHSKRVTVADSTMGHAQNRGGGGNGYLFEVSRSSEVLFRDLAGIAGRHNFIQNWDFGTSGTVWLRTTSREGFAASTDNESFGLVGLSEYHHSLAMANLVDDSTTDDGWGAVNRRGWSSGAGHSATQNVFWNLRGEGIVRSFQYGEGYVIGTAPTLDVQAEVGGDWDLFGAGDGTSPDDFLEGIGEAASLRPQSLYEDQRARRVAR